MTTGEAAFLLHIGATTLRRWERRGRIGCVKDVRGRRYFCAGDVYELRDRPGGHPPPLTPAAPGV
ncbi:MerR family transcriptional regulator [Nocardiopsis potens]|uniref:MerR family transcriptional regulator n=1 Tax=Nocardiopsis potens TaxID=1246458 RepID=UPI0023AA1C9F|nr:MerR family transcriptional regulator [Nocardiopsis potens]